MKIRIYIRKLHKYLGLFSAIWLLMLATTGLLLQNERLFSLQDKYIQSPVLLSLYDIGNQYIAFGDMKNYIIQTDYQLIVNGNLSEKLDEEIVSAIFNGSMWIAATSSRVYWFDRQGNELQRLDEFDGLVTPVLQLGQYQNRIIVKTHNGNYEINDRDKHLQDYNNADWGQFNQSEELKLLAWNLYNAQFITAKKLILDFHSGLTSSVVLNNLAGIGLIIISISGILLYFQAKPRRKLHKVNKSEVK